MKMKFKGHQTFFIRKGWLSKGIRAVENDDTIFMPSKAAQAMDELGLGSNQVVALRYWLGVVGLIEKSKTGKSHSVTPLCNLILERDPYIEEMGTLWALHYNLACNRSEATSWYVFFNELKVTSFTKSDVVACIQKFKMLNGEEDEGKPSKSTATSSFESDVNCIMQTYISHERLDGKPVSPENVIDCPFGDLGIVDIDNRQLRTFRKKPANLSSLPSLLVLYSIMGMLERERELDERAWSRGNEIPLDELLNGRFSPGLLFNLDSIALLSKLYELETDGYIRINRTAGSDVVRLCNPEFDSYECLARYYELIG